MTGLASPNIDGIPHVKSPAVKDRLIAGILETDVLKEQYLPCENGYYRIEKRILYNPVIERNHHTGKTN